MVSSGCTIWSFGYNLKVQHLVLKGPFRLALKMVRVVAAEVNASHGCRAMEPAL